MDSMKKREKKRSKKIWLVQNKELVNHLYGNRNPFGLSVSAEHFSSIISVTSRKRRSTRVRNRRMLPGITFAASVKHVRTDRATKFEANGEFLSEISNPLENLCKEFLNLLEGATILLAGNNLREQQKNVNINKSTFFFFHQKAST